MKLLVDELDGATSSKEELQNNKNLDNDSNDLKDFNDNA
jgi:hypothetical protein